MISPISFISVINSYLPEPHASLLNGIIFGINLKTTKEFYQQLKIIGLLHIVVLSGINITMLAGIITNMTINFGKRISTLITILSIISFILFVGPQAPVIRAGIMGILTLVAILFGKRNLIFYSMFLSIIYIAIFFPKWLTSVSLYLSYGATLGIIIFGQTKSKNFIIRDLKTSLAAQIFTTPIIFIYFRQISLISPFANLFISPIIAPLMVFGFLTAILGKINFLLGFIPAQICYALLSYCVFIISLLSKIPFVYFSFK
jgi:competence protein ComEC